MLKFTPSFIPANILVIGCGGTGSRLVPLLAQFIRSITANVSPQGWVVNPAIYLVDDDLVEAKNLVRQNFIERDIGRPKAVVLAERYGQAYNVSIIPMVSKVEMIRRGFNCGIPDIAGNDIIVPQSLIISCVDSIKARLNILSHLVTRPRPGDMLFIDAGNEDTFGQVSYSTCNIKQANSSASTLVNESVNSVAYYPCKEMPLDLYKYISMEGSVSAKSCADLDQSLVINSLMANFIMVIVQNLYYSVPMDYNEIRFNTLGYSEFVKNTVPNMLKRVFPHCANSVNLLLKALKAEITFSPSLGDIEKHSNYVANFMKKNGVLFEVYKTKITPNGMALDLPPITLGPSNSTATSKSTSTLPSETKTKQKASNDGRHRDRPMPALEQASTVGHSLGLPTTESPTAVVIEEVVETVSGEAAGLEMPLPTMPPLAEVQQRRQDTRVIDLPAPALGVA